MPEIRKGDTVVVLTGKDAGKRGTVERVLPTAALAVASGGKSGAGWQRRRRWRRRVVVEGLNIAKRHTKPRQTAGHDRPRAEGSSRAGSSTSPSR